MIQTEYCILENIIKQEEFKALDKAIAKLDERSQYVIKSIFGIGGTEQKTGRMIAKELGCTPQLIAHIKRIALKKLRSTKELQDV